MSVSILVEFALSYLEHRAVGSVDSMLVNELNSPGPSL